jgi:hypothetical protein
MLLCSRYHGVHSTFLVTAGPDDYKTRELAASEPSVVEEPARFSEPAFDNI